MGCSFSDFFVLWCYSGWVIIKPQWRGTYVCINNATQWKHTLIISGYRLYKAGLQETAILDCYGHMLISKCVHKHAKCRGHPSPRQLGALKFLLSHIWAKIEVVKNQNGLFCIKMCACSISAMAAVYLTCTQVVETWAKVLHVAGSQLSSFIPLDTGNKIPVHATNFQTMMYKNILFNCTCGNSTGSSLTLGSCFVLQVGNKSPHNLLWYA